MTENVQIALIVVGSITVVLVAGLWMFKDRLDIFNFSASKKQISAKMERHQDTADNVSRNTLSGDENEIDVRKDNVTLEDNLLEGNKNKISVNTNTTKSNRNG
ncbi:MAG: hypothetical protein Q8Q54_02085 [Methylococcales bacterium]|nr:hypothetical protein [Methylococcales bacterium]MDP3837691.1 hypothetical protein [Methylococcales bacterium]